MSLLCQKFVSRFLPDQLGTTNNLFLSYLFSKAVLLLMFFLGTDVSFGGQLLATNNFVKDV